MGWQSVNELPDPPEAGVDVTVTTTLLLTEPPLFVATRLYEVVAVGFTVIGLVAAAPFKVTVGLDPVTVQLNTELPPAATDVADAVKLAITGAVTDDGEVFAADTATEMLLVAVPPGPDAVSVKVVGLDTVVEPESLVVGTDPDCVPFVNVAEVAPLNVYARWTVPPAVTVVGLTVKLIVGFVAAVPCIVDANINNAEQLNRDKRCNLRKYFVATLRPACVCWIDMKTLRVPRVKPWKPTDTLRARALLNGFARHSRPRRTVLPVSHERDWGNSQCPTHALRTNTAASSF